MTLTQRFSLYLQLTRLNRPIGILLLLWPTLWGVWVAGGGYPAWHIVALFVLGTVLMRSAGCAINDYADRNIDKHVQRTRQRPLTSGKLAPRETLYLAAALALLALLLILPLNALTIWLSLAAVFLAGSYPFTKRFLAIPQAYLGIAFGCGIPMAFAAQTNALPSVAWWLMLANIFWCIAYDTEYAMVDRDDDIHLGIHSSALLFGKFDVLAVMSCYAIALGLLAWVGLQLHLAYPFYLGWLAAVGIATYHFTLIRERQRDGCFKAFLHNNWFGAAIFSGIVLSYLS